jgi:ribosomal protein S18 acetylase RimI-like enzyme
MSIPTAVFGRLDIVQADVSLLDEIVSLFDGYRQFYGQASDPAAARAFLHERFERRESVIFLAKSADSHGIGFVQLYPSFSSVALRRLWILNDLFVTPEARRRGVAKALMTCAEAFSRDTGAKGLMLDTAVENLAAQSLYESLGWRRVSDYFAYSHDHARPLKASGDRRAV